MPAKSTTAVVAAQNTPRRAAADNLPVKWRGDAPVVRALPAVAEAIAAFRKEFDLNRLGFVQVFHSRTCRVAVYGCKLSVEFSNRRTLHMRMRPPGSPWLLTADLVAAWPELHSYVSFISLDRAWLRVALANIFEAWSKDWLPPGYRYPNPLGIVDNALGDLLNTPDLARQWENALIDVLPREFFRAFGAMPSSLGALPNLAAPFRIWNQHSEELESLRAAEPWLREIAPLLRYFPADLSPGPTLEHSLRLMVVKQYSTTVWRFHRRSQFAIVPGGDLLVRRGARAAAAIVTGAVKGLGLDQAVTFLMAMGAERFTRMYIDLNEHESKEAWAGRMPLFMARAAARLNQASAPEDREEVMEQIIMVLRGLVRAGFAGGFPASNSTWSSLLERAETWNAPDDRGAEVQNLPKSWTAPLAQWAHGEVKFNAIDSLKDLRAEGVQMVHCVESRYVDCATGNSVVYRIQGCLPDGQSIRATVEFSATSRRRWHGGVARTWVLQELKGRFNAEVDPALRKIALLALAALNDAG